MCHFDCQKRLSLSMYVCIYLSKGKLTLIRDHLGINSLPRFWCTNVLSIVPRTTKKSFQTQSNGENFLQRFLFWRLESHFKRLLSPLNFRDGSSIWSAKWPQWPHYGRRTMVEMCSDPYFWSNPSFSAVAARNFMIIYGNPYLRLRRS